MKLSIKLIQNSLIILVAFLVWQLLPAAPVAADHGLTAAECNALGGTPAEVSLCRRHAAEDGITSGGGTEPEEPSPIECGDGGVRLGVPLNDGEECIGEDGNAIYDYLSGIIRFLSAGVGVVVTAMIVVGGIQYSAAGDNPQAITAAKTRIWNAIIALIMYIMMVGMLNFLVPGGVL